MVYCRCTNGDELLHYIYCTVFRHYYSTIQTHLAESAVIGLVVSMVIASEWARDTGTRTAVQEMAISLSLSSNIFRVSHTTFISSLV